MATILDISHHQVPSSMNYDKLAKEVDFVIIRTQYGSNLTDKHYKTHHKEFQKRGVPTAAYAWVRGVSKNDMKVEARDFYNRTKEFNPTFWFADVEEQSMGNMRKGTNAFIKELRKQGAKKVGIYVGHHLYKKFNLKMKDADAVWIPKYGSNNGKPNSKPDFKCDLHQYTDKGRLKGYNGPLDLNQIISKKKLSYFTDGKKSSSKKDKNKDKTKKSKLNTKQKGKWVKNITKGNVNFYDSPRWDNPTGIFGSGDGWTIQGKLKVGNSHQYKVKNSKGKTYYVTANTKYVKVTNKKKKTKKKYHKIKSGDTLSQIAVNHKTSTKKLQKLNGIKNANKIQIGQKIRVK